MRKLLFGNKSPEDPFSFITIVYVIILLILTLVKPSKVPLPNLLVHSREIHFFVAFGFSCILVLAFFTTLVMLRLFERKKNRAQKKCLTIKFICCKTWKDRRIDIYWIFVVLHFACLVAIGIIMWWLSNSWQIFILITFTDLYLLCCMTFNMYYVANDFEFLENIDSVNIRVKQHNQRIDNLKKEIEDIKS